MEMFGAMLLLPIYLQNIRGFTPLESGLLLLPGAILMGIMSPISGALFDRIGARPLAILGLIITAITTFEFSTITSDTTYNQIMVLYTVWMFGMSLLMRQYKQLDSINYQDIWAVTVQQCQIQYDKLPDR